MERSSVQFEAQETTSSRRSVISRPQTEAPSISREPILVPEVFNALETRFGEKGLDRLREDFDSGHEFAYWSAVVPEDIIKKCCEEADRLKPFFNRAFVPFTRKGGSIGMKTLEEKNSLFVEFYRSAPLKEFLERLIQKPLQTCPNFDNHACAVYSYTEVGDHITWHYDNSFYNGSRYTILISLRDTTSEDSCLLSCQLYTRAKDKEVKSIDLKLTPGMMVIFNGDTLWHSVTPLTVAGGERLVFSMEFVTDTNMSYIGRVCTDVKDAVNYFGLQTVLMPKLRSVWGTSSAASETDPNKLLAIDDEPMTSDDVSSSIHTTSTPSSSTQTTLRGHQQPPSIRSSMDVTGVPALSSSRSGSFITDASEVAGSIPKSPPSPPVSGRFRDMVAFVNPVSGAQRGGALHSRLVEMLGAAHVYDLSQQDPLPGLLEHIHSSPNLRVIACGGDGTIRWVLQTMVKMDVRPLAKIGVIPLGTGNDLSRQYGWGVSYTPGSKSDLIQTLERIRTATTRPLDLWQVRVTPRDPETGLEDRTKSTTDLMFNYFNMGLNAQASLGFHSLRSHAPSLFQFRTMNKWWYLYNAASNIIKGTVDLSSSVRLLVDSELVPIPNGITTLVLLNFTNYQAGLDIWGPHKENDPKFRRPSMNDGVLEVVGLGGAYSEALVRLYVSHGTRIAQGRSIRLEVNAHVAVAYDGEPVLQPPCVIEVQTCGQVDVLYNPEKD